MKLPESTYDALIEYSQANKADYRSSLIRNLKTTIKSYIQPHLKLPDKVSIDTYSYLKKVSVTVFISRAETIFDKAYAEAIKQGKNKQTLDNNKSSLKRFISWIRGQSWYYTIATRQEQPLRTPALKHSQTLVKSRKGFKAFGSEPYSLTREQAPTGLIEQVEKLRVFWTSKIDPNGLRKDSFVKSLTFDGHVQFAFLFLGWVLKYEIPSIKLQKEKQVEHNEKKLSEPEQGLEQLLSEPISLRLLADLTLLKKFVAWGVNVRGNSNGWVVRVLNTAVFVSKYLYAGSSKEENYVDIQPIKDIRDYRKAFAKEYKPKIRQTKDEKVLSPQQMQLILDYLWRCTAVRNASGGKRTDRTIIRSWQRYLIILILHHYPIRSREIRELELGETLKYGYCKLANGVEREAYYCEMDDEDTKTEESKKWVLDPDIFNQPLNEWLRIWRPKAQLDHNSVFFMCGNSTYPETEGQPFTSKGQLYSLVRTAIYRACCILKDEAQALVDAGEVLPKHLDSFLTIDPKRTNPHFFRHLASTDLRRQGASHEQKKAFHKIIGNSVAMGDKSYTLLELEEETQQAITWRKDLEQKLPLKQHENLSRSLQSQGLKSVNVEKLVSILTPEQKRELGLL